jgi:hypothetical protein
MTNAVLAKLRALVTGTAIEECELCACTISTEHAHLLEPEARRVLCACPECASLHAREQHRPQPRYLRVERRAVKVNELELDDHTWAELGVTASLAYFTTRHRTGEVVATFPGRAGLIEAFVPLRAWSELERRFPVLTAILPEVEALLVRRTSRHREAFRVSIDHCYELASLLRSSELPLAAPELPSVQAFFAGLERAHEPNRHSRRPSA